MVQSLEEYVAQATNAYKPAQTAIQNQLNALSGQLDTANQQINKNYAQQQSTLNRNRNMAAESASLQAAGSGGSFGGSANIANRKYYDQTFVPAQTQLQTNQANELAQARQNNENQRVSLQTQMANLESQANQEALRQYWAAVEAEKQREAQERASRAAAAAANSANRYLMDAMKAAQQGGGAKQNVDFATWVKNYSGYNNNTKNFLLNGINNTSKFASLPGAANSQIVNATAKALQNSAYYKQYLKWRNS